MITETKGTEGTEGKPDSKKKRIDTYGHGGKSAAQGEHFYELTERPVRVGQGGPPLKHGGRSFALLSSVMNPEVREWAEVIKEIAPRTTTSDEVSVMVMAKGLVAFNQAFRWFYEEGHIVTAEGELAPGAEVFVKLLNALGRWVDRFGMAPAARVALGIGLIQAEGLAAAIQGVREQERSQAAEGRGKSQTRLGEERTRSSVSVEDSPGRVGSGDGRAKE